MFVGVAPGGLELAPVPGLDNQSLPRVSEPGLGV